MAMVQLQSYGFTTVEDPLSDGGNFTKMFGSPNGAKVPSSGVCEPHAIGSADGSYWSGAVVQSGDSWPADHYVELTLLTGLVATVIVWVLAVRASKTADTFYQMNLAGPSGTSGTQFLYSRVAGVATQIGSFTAAPTDGDVWRLTVSGTTITVTQNGVQKLSVVDSTIPSGVPGFQLYNATAIADVRISLFAAGANQAATPTFNPIAGSYATAQNVKISSSTPGGLIYYTTDGSTPTHSSSSIANGGTVTVSTPLTIKAFASVTDFADSATGSAAYTGSLTPGNNSSWLSVNNNNVLRGSRSH